MLETFQRIHQRRSLPDLEQIITLSPAFRNSLAKAYPIPGLKHQQALMA